ncbi:7TM diverse intracellular signaling domain-containing protein [Aureibacter tunicatorum]|uniref:histidine kinase n=1 Tax=Aureibacter tunicatorum TaxID=866807 RepID=A0AAE4BSR3_9BACT|nr:7TM diverse intracellular signaling domain-containing protein [Aureibacter tunicatorum]MDR6241479.1 signal transduction histidine kinase [Aureibacter tunicatorum]BDD06678.1 hypothetical protein AUTU_41610 [Aureibacter tunicatorum]
MVDYIVDKWRTSYPIRLSWKLSLSNPQSILIFMLSYFIGGNAYSQSITQGNTLNNLNPKSIKTIYLHTSESPNTNARLIKAWKKVNASGSLAPFKTHYLKIPLSNQTVINEWVLSFDQATNISCEILDIHGKTISESFTGKFIPRNEKFQYSGYGEHAIIKVPSMSESTLLVRIENQANYNINTSVTIKPLRTWTFAASLKNLWHGFFFGAIFIMLIYNASLFLLSKDLSYLYYSLFLASGILFFSIEFNFLPLILNIDGKNYAWTTTSFFITIIFYFLFLQHFLKNNLQPKWLELSFKFFITTTILAFIINSSIAYFDVGNYFHIMKMLAPVITGLSIFLIGALIYYGNKGSKYVFLSAGVIAFMAAWQIIEYKQSPSLMPPAPYKLQIGLFLEYIIFSIGLTFRYKENSEAKRVAQEKLFEEIQKNEQALKSINADLEKKVKLRTMEIQSQNEELTQQKEEIQMQAEALQNANNKLLELDSFKASMTNMIAHDLKNPLSTIMNDKLASEESRLAGKSLLTLIQNMLDVKKYENSQISLSFEKNDIIKLFGRSISLIKPTLSSKSISIEITAPDTLFVRMDANLIERVFINLLSNAIKHSPNNGTIHISFEKPDDNMLNFSIHNEGEAIPNIEIENIFKAYYQHAIAKQEHDVGTGLGLCFCKLVIEAHKGQIKAHKNMEFGAKFTFSLPLDSALEQSKNINAPSISTLNSQEIDFLQPYFKKLSNLDVYEFSKIKRILKEIAIPPTLNQKAIETWIHDIEDATYASDQERFESLTSLEIAE